MILVYSCAQKLLVGLVGSMEELVPCASLTTCGKCLLGTETQWLIVIFYLYLWLNFCCKYSVKSLSRLQRNSILNFFPWQLLTVLWLFYFIFYLPFPCPQSPCCCDEFFVFSLSLHLLGQLNFEQNSKVLKFCLV